MNSLDKFFTVLYGIVGVAMITTVVGHPGTAKDVTAGGQAFAGSLRAAEGN